MQKPHWTAPASDERVLHRMELAVRAGEPLDGDDVVPVRLRRQNEAGADELAVEQHGARAALALLAGVLRPGQPEPLAKREEQALARPDVGLAPLAVDGQLDPHRGASAVTDVQTRDDFAATLKTGGQGRRPRGETKRALTRPGTVRGRGGQDAQAWRRYAAVPRTSSIGLAAEATSAGNARPPQAARARARHRAAEPNAARSSPRSWSTDTASEHTAITIALRGPTFMNVCGAPDGGTSTATISSSGASAFRFGPTRNSSSGSRRVPPDARDLDLGVLDEQRRQRVARRRGRAEVPAERPAVADLRRADRPRRLGQRRQQRPQRLRHRLGVRQPGAEPEHAVLARPAAQLLHLAEVQDHLAAGAGRS